MANNKDRRHYNHQKISFERRDLSLVGQIRRFGWFFVEIFFSIGLGVRLTLLTLIRSRLLLTNPRMLIRQLMTYGIYTLIIILIAGLFVGLVLGLQFYVLLDRYGQQQHIGVGVALTLFRELGPVSSGLLFVGCACSSITANIGLKKASEQIAAMDIMAVDPIAYELSPRLWAAIIALPVLTVYFDLVGMFGGYLIVVGQIGVDEGVFWAGIKEQVRFYDDFVLGIFKSLFFGIVGAMIALYEGYFCLSTAEGVAKATTRTVIKGSLAILGVNFLLTAFMID